VHPEHPELSGLVLSLVDRAGRPQNGFLRAFEISRLRLDAGLVVLSACESGIGTDLRGEGMASLARSFFHAGARRVVATLWPVSDEKTATLMERFYRGHLAAGKPPAAALRAAQLAALREPATREPYYWAGFVLQGDWRREP
jgi:CHAT domain-containing protein